MRDECLQNAETNLTPMRVISTSRVVLATLQEAGGQNFTTWDSLWQDLCGPHQAQRMEAPALFSGCQVVFKVLRLDGAGSPSGHCTLLACRNPVQTNAWKICCSTLSMKLLFTCAGAQHADNSVRWADQPPIDEQASAIIAVHAAANKLGEKRRGVWTSPGHSHGTSIN
jgi:hypothetical protein